MCGGQGAASCTVLFMENKYRFIRSFSGSSEIEMIQLNQDNLKYAEAIDDTI